MARAALFSFPDRPLISIPLTVQGQLACIERAVADGFYCPIRLHIRAGLRLPWVSHHACGLRNPKMMLSPGSSSSGGRRYSMDNFSPAGLHVLVVDDDPLCLMVLERMLQQCNYRVTTSNRVNRALELLRENKDAFDLVLSDVYMPDEDGFKLLEVIGLELDLPVIMMSANGETSVVMKGITHGACDYLIKPVRMEELRNIWQHVIRRKGKDSPKLDVQGEWNDSGRTTDSQENFSKKRKEVVELTDETGEDINSLKKARVNWSVQLHQQFVNAVNRLGVEKAVPKKILDIMNVQGLTRENVASHLQKYRLYLKRLSGVVPEPCPIASFQVSEDGSFGGTMLVLPGGKNAPAVKGLNLGAGVGSGSASERSIDPATMKALSQFKASQAKQAANRAQVLGGLGFVDQHVATTSGGLQRMASLDLSYFLQEQQTDQSLAGQSLASTDTLDDLAAHSFKNVKLEEDEVTGMSRRSQRRQAVTEGLIARWDINPGLGAQQDSGGNAISQSAIHVPAATTNRPANIEITEDVCSSNLAPESSSSTGPDMSGEEAFAESGFDSLVDLGSAGLMPNSALDVSDYLLDEVFSYQTLESISWGGSSLT